MNSTIRSLNWVSAILAVLSLCFFSLLSAEEVGTAKPWVVDIEKQMYAEYPRLVYSDSPAYKFAHRPGYDGSHVCIGKEYYYIGQRVFRKASAEYLGTLNLPLSTMEDDVCANPIQGVAAISKGSKLYFIDEARKSTEHIADLPETTKVNIDRAEIDVRIASWQPVFVSTNMVVLSGVVHWETREYGSWNLLFRLPINSEKAGEVEYLGASQEHFYPMNSTAPIIGVLEVKENDKYDEFKGNAEFIGLFGRVQTWYYDLRDGGCKVRLLPRQGLAWCDSEKKYYLYSEIRRTKNNKVEVVANVTEAATNTLLFSYAMPEIQRKQDRAPQKYHCEDYFRRYTRYLNACSDKPGHFQLWGTTQTEKEEKRSEKPAAKMLEETQYHNFFYNYQVVNGRVEVKSHVLEPQSSIVASWNDMALLSADGMIIPISFEKPFEYAYLQEKFKREYSYLAFDDHYSFNLIPAFPKENYFILFYDKNLEYYSTRDHKPVVKKTLNIGGYSQAKYIWRKDSLVFRRRDKADTYKTDKRLWEYCSFKLSEVLDEENCLAHEWVKGNEELDREFEEFTFRVNVFESALKGLSPRKTPVEILGCSGKVLLYIEKDWESGKHKLFSFDGTTEKQVLETERPIVGTVGIKNEFVIVGDFNDYYLCYKNKMEKISLPEGFLRIQYAFDGDIILEDTIFEYRSMIDTRKATIYIDKIVPEFDDKTLYYCFREPYFTLEGFGMGWFLVNSSLCRNVYTLEKRELKETDKHLKWLQSLEEICKRMVKDE